MKVSLKPLRQQVMVITGASSGIGLATARMAAKQGARLVLASRNANALADIVRQIESEGGNATYVEADVGNRNDIEQIAHIANQHFGGFDTWVNNAGSSIWGRVEDSSDEDNRQLFETNFWGVVYGSATAARHLRKRGGGAIINLGSVASDMAFPYMGFYSATKHAVKAFTDALRIDLEMEKAAISVTLIKPTGIDTPFAQHAKNYTGKEARLPDPVYHPDEVANAICHAAVHPQRDIYIGGAAYATSWMNEMSPSGMDWLRKNVFAKQELHDHPPQSPEGTLNRPGKGGRVRGAHDGYVMKTSLYTRASLHPALTGIALGAGAAAIAWMTRGHRA
ncbi:MAG: SDR family NAD(P)-dependent oxidoreductase [Gemmataceae bacterium]|nr:SDR family NAD(P)-dependent oxidoreductase [Gemmataceae bacterium]